MYIHICTYIYVYIHACMHACVCTFLYTYKNIYLVLLVLARTGRGNSPKLHQVLCPHTQTAQKTTHRRGTKKGEKLPQCLCAQAAGVDAICVSAWRHYLVYLESLSEQRLGGEAETVTPASEAVNHVRISGEVWGLGLGFRVWDALHDVRWT